MSRRDSRLRIVVLGYIVRGPLGGLAWHHLQYVLGLARLGHDVVFLEESGDYASCYDPSSNRRTTDPSYGLAFAAMVFDRVGLPERWAYHDAHTGRWIGPRASDVLTTCASAELCLNLSGLNTLSPAVAGIGTRVLVDTDPAFTQVRHLSDPDARAQARAHTAFFTFAENLPAGRSTIPPDGFAWQPTRQPIVLSEWPVLPGPAEGNFTTVMLWDSYSRLEFEGCVYGVKSDSFAPYTDLPQRVGGRLELALGSPSAPGEYLEARGWTVVDPRRPTLDPWTYQQYIQRSKAEFSVAKQAYVATRSGWFSERSAAYLASGRPVVVQDTAFGEWLPTGEGVLPFSTPEQAADAIARVHGDYPAQCARARAIAEAYFDSERVLESLVDRAMSASSVGAR